MTYSLPKTRVGSIIEIIDVDKGSTFYADFICGRLELIYRITENTIISNAGILNAEQIPRSTIPIAILKPKFKVLFF
jgi:hypothetical protein